MAKIPFDIKFRPQIESGEYKVFAHEHEEQEARIVCWDNKGEYPIVALVDNEPEKFDRHGRVPGGNRGGEFSLFIITPEPEMTAFEKKVYAYCDGKTVGEELIKRIAKELLSLAREQFIKDGYVIEKKAFHDAVENISDKHRAEMSVQYSIHCKVEDGTRHAIMNWDTFQKVAQKFINIGKAEALKDLPRWRRWENGACGNGQGIPLAIVKRGLNGYELVDALGIQGEQYIMLSDLEKLPGFNGEMLQ